jgi:branched-chain amino acid transport system ATP-binding protein
MPAGRSAGGAQAPPALQLDGVSKSFGSFRALDDVSLTVDAGEALGIVGPNGAGKTTLLNVIGGAFRADRGSLVFEGQDLARLPLHRRCRAGIGRTFQIPRPFSGLTAYENVLVAHTYGRAGGDRHAETACVTVLERVGLRDKANVVAGSLTLLQRKRLELARALVTEPRLLLIDEVAGGLTEPEVNELVETVKQVHAEGVAIVWIEHIVHALLAVVDRLLCLAEGRILIVGDPHEVMASPMLRDVYLGREL